MRDVPRMPGVDGRTRRARRFREAYAALTRELARAPTAVERALLVDAAVLITDSEAIAARPDPDARVRISYALGEALRRLGIATPRREPEPDPRAAAMRSLGIEPR